MFESDDHIFPAKPELVKENKKSTITKFALSALLFIGLFLSLFSDNYIFILEIIGILLIHEIGHLIFMKKYGYKSLSMIFIPFLGAMVGGDTKETTQKQKFIISLMGPLPGILIGSGLFIAFIFNPENEGLLELSLLFISINLLNLIPVDPLDGGHIVEALLFPQNDTIKMYFTVISSFIIIGTGFYFDFVILTLFGFFMAFKVRGFQKSQRIYEGLDDIDFDYERDYNDLTNKDYWTIRRVFLENNPKIQDMIPSEMTLWENERLIVDQIKQLLKMKVRLDLTPVKSILLFLIYLMVIAFPIFLLSINWHLIQPYLAPNGL
ncbi:MAG: site-2 protease family protein [Crocinitomicaceae bacterium]